MEHKAPTYAKGPLIRCYYSMIATLELLDISMHGIEIVSRFPMMNDRLRNATTRAGHEITEEMKTNFAKSEKSAAFADGEVKNGFPFLHAFATVGAWGALEVAIEDMLVGILLNEPEILGKEEIEKIRIPLARYDQLDREERMRFILQELTRTQAGAAQGVNVFENVLKVFDLSGQVDEGTKKCLWEMNHVRNVIVHRGSVADLRLVESCPWLNLKMGDRLAIDHNKFWAYSVAIFDYVDILIERLRKRFDVSSRLSANAPYSTA